jgi:hypothetical protein
MSDLALDPVDDDLLVDGGLLALVRGADALVQRLELRLGLVRGSWFLDQDQGVPYVEQVLVKGADGSTIGSLLRTEALREPDLREARATVTLDPATRSARATVSAQAVDGVRVEAAVTLVAAAPA